MSSIRCIINDIIFFIKPYWIGETQCGYTWENAEIKSLPYDNELKAQQGAINWVKNGGDVA